MKALLIAAFGASFLGTAVVCAMAGEAASTPTVTASIGSVSNARAASGIPASIELKPSMSAEEAAPRHPVRVVLALPYAAH